MSKSIKRDKDEDRKSFKRKKRKQAKRMREIEFEDELWEIEDGKYYYEDDDYKDYSERG